MFLDLFMDVAVVNKAHLDKLLIVESGRDTILLLKLVLKVSPDMHSGKIGRASCRERV